MWKPEHRQAADRSGLRYPSDLTDGEWAIVEPMIPPARHGGRKRSVNVREVLNGIFYVLWSPVDGKRLFLNCYDRCDTCDKDNNDRYSRSDTFDRDV
jgi:hypothetical protein